MTKIFSLLAIAILVIPSTFFISRYSGLQAKTSDKLSEMPVNHPHETITDLGNSLHPFQDKVQSRTPNGEDDGNTHVFHFDRLKGKRRRLALCLIAKSILTIAHLAWLVKEIMHLCH